MKSKNQDTLDFMRNIIGEEKFQEVAMALAGERVTFPVSFRWHDKEVRNQCILNDFYNGVEVEELAQKYELSKPHIYKIVEGRY